MVETHRSQFLTWIPGFLGNYEHLRVAQIAIRCVAGLVVVAGLGGPKATTYMLSMRWDVANYSREKTQEFVDDLEAAVLWLVTKRIGMSQSARFWRSKKNHSDRGRSS